MTFSLGPRAAAAGFRLASFDTIGSTSTEAMERARAGEHGPLWIVARSQSEGRGRRGREWQTDEGNLAASVLLHLPIPPAKAATLGFAAGLAVSDALRASAPTTQFTLKWPNDVLAAGAKICGILLESEQIGGGLALVVGIGINVVNAPQDIPYPATSLRALGASATAEELFRALSDAWVEWQAAWDEGRGLDALRALWLERAAGLGERLNVHLGDRILSGIFETLDAEGRLVLRTDGGEAIAVPAGEIQFGADVAAPNLAGVR